MDKVRNSLSDSSFFRKLISYYRFSPSAIIIRTAEAEQLSRVPMIEPVLDLCCGDGYFGSLIRQKGFAWGCDINRRELQKADRQNIYKALVCADISMGIPAKADCFNTIIVNSALEHIKNLDGTLNEIARVLRPGGMLYLTFLSSFAYDWWPCGKDAKKQYLNYQPVFNHYTAAEWKNRLSSVGLKVKVQQFYLSKAATQVCLFFDYYFSRVYMTESKTPARLLLKWMPKLPDRLWDKLWERLFSPIKILSPKKGGGILIAAQRK